MQHDLYVIAYKLLNEEQDIVDVATAKNFETLEELYSFIRDQSGIVLSDEQKEDISQMKYDVKLFMIFPDLIYMEMPCVSVELTKIKVNN